MVERKDKYSETIHAVTKQDINQLTIFSARAIKGGIR